MFHPIDLGWIWLSFSGDFMILDCFWSARVGAINVTNEIISSEDRKQSRLPQQIIILFKFGGKKSVGHWVVERKRMMV